VKRLIHYVQTFALILLTAPDAISENKVEQNRFDEYKKNYAADHAKLTQTVNPAFNVTNLFNMLSDANAAAFSDTPETVVSGQTPGYRTGNGNGAYSEMYASRKNVLFKDIGGALNANQNQADDLKANAATWMRNMDTASGNSNSYLSIIQAGAQESSYLNLELIQARVDLMRQMDMQARAAAEEMQDDADETWAFEQAVKSWTNPASDSGY
jgi:hypothetical protein